MSSSEVGILLALVPDDEIIRFFRCKKTEISSGVDEPLLFLNLLKDFSLVPEDLYQKVKKMKNKQNGVYTVLELIEMQGAQSIKAFWSCVFQEHIQHKYPFLRLLQNSLFVSCRVSDLRALEIPTGNEQKKVEQKKCETKRKRSAVELEEDAGSSSVSSSSQNKRIYSSYEKMEESSEEEESEYEVLSNSDSDSGELSHFEAAALPVKCGSYIGVLHKNRFAGSHIKSIRTEECWFSPEEFVKQDLTLPDGHWKTDILCHGKTLDHLVKIKILDVHPVGCRCQQCNPKDRLNEDKDDFCFICNDEGNVVRCTTCPRAFHHNCHLPTLDEKTSEGKWMCTFCVLKSNQRLWIPMSKDAVLKKPFSENIMRCEYLLLYLFKADKQHMFADDPTENNLRYRSVIRYPMWLGKVKKKLKNKKYRVVSEFVHDINLTFDNWISYNKDDTNGRMAAKMKKIFQKEFDIVFKIE